MQNGPMRILLLVTSGRLCRWHLDLARRLEADGHDVLLRFRSGPALLPAALDLLTQCEAMLLRRRTTGPSDRLDDREADRLRRDGGHQTSDIVIDLTGEAEPVEGATLVPLYDGTPGDVALAAILLDRRLPTVSIAAVGPDGLAVIDEARPAVERPDVFLVGRDAVCGRLPGMIRRVVADRCGPGGNLVDLMLRAHPRPVTRTDPARFLLGSVAAVAGRKLKRLLVRDDHWHIGLRRLARPEDGVAHRLDWPSTCYAWIDDDRRRYYADPFLFERDGVTWLFCEEYPYATRKGIISAAPLGPDGRPLHAPRPVLEPRCHASYPFVFAHAGEIWMIPETSNALTLELYRAVEFPWRWEFDRTLLDDVSLADATIFAKDGRFWMTAAYQEPATSSWDTLAVYVADDKLGPWRPIAAEPLLIDAAVVRPAGKVFEHDGELFRPAQDCRAGYGSALSICRIDAIGEGRFEQTLIKRLAPPSGGPALGVHTLNTLGAIETIDACGPRPRFSRVEAAAGAGAAGSLAAASLGAITILGG